MTAHIIDVGQGAAALLEFSCGAVLIDTGGEQNTKFKSRDALKTYLNDFFERRADLNRTLALVVLSHPHDDHYRGASDLLNEDNNFTITAVVDNGGLPLSPFNGQRKLQNWARENADYLGIRNEDMPGSSGIAGGTMDPFDCADVDPLFSALWGTTSVQPDEWSNSAFKNPNNHSVVLRVDFGEASFLFLGDLEDDGEAGLLEKYAGSTLLDVDIVQASHHGADNGTSQALLDVATPELILVPVGDSAREVGSKSAFSHGHARKEVIQRFDAQLSRERDAKTIKAATAPKQFESMTISKAIYGTGWDGDIRLTVNSDGTIEAVETQ
jgi:competence protein ComEC